jgi:hypothetical protein
MTEQSPVAAARFKAAATGAIGFLKKKQQLGAIGLIKKEQLRRLWEQHDGSDYAVNSADGSTTTA